jgi:ABC-2 type transport system ATP-binding protein
MKQRLKLAAAIVHDPQFLILDEPTNGMDPAGREEILELARDLSRNKNMSLLFSSHLLPDVEAVCDHVVVLGSGKLLASGLIRDLKKVHQQVFEVRVKAGAEQFVQRLQSAGCTFTPMDELLVVVVPTHKGPDLFWDAARASRTQIRHLRPRRSTLEEVFLKAVEGDN